MYGEEIICNAGAVLLFGTSQQQVVREAWGRKKSRAASQHSSADSKSTREGDARGHKVDRLLAAALHRVDKHPQQWLQQARHDLLHIVSNRVRREVQWHNGYSRAQLIGRTSSQPTSSSSACTVLLKL